MHENHSLKNKALSFQSMKIINTCLIIPALFITALNSCSSRNALRKKVVNTRKVISSGFRMGNTIYFLCEYVLSKSGSTVIPMYIYTPGTIYLDKVFLYSINIPEEKLTQIADLKPVSSYAGRGKVDYAKWAYADSKLYVSYSTGWDKETKKYIYEIFSFDIKTKAVNELVKNNGKRIMDKYFSSGKSGNAISMSQVMYYAGCISDEEWQLPSPLEYSTKEKENLEKIIIEQVGDLAFKDAVFQIIRKSITKKDADRIIASMKKWNEDLPGDKQMIYKPHMEKWSARLSMAARMNAPNDGPSADSLDFLEAAFRDDAAKLGEMLKTIDINTADENKCTALMYSIFGKAPHTMEILIKNGADLRRESGSGYIAWMFVSNTGLRQRYIKLTKM